MYGRLLPISYPAACSQIATLCNFKGMSGKLWLCILSTCSVGVMIMMACGKRAVACISEAFGEEKSKHTIGEESRNIWNPESRRSKARRIDWVMDRKQGERLTSEKVSYQLSSTEGAHVR